MCFARKRDLDIHVQTKHDDRTWQCDQCEKTFSSEAYLKYHKDRVHKESRMPVVKKLKCEECHLRFASSYYLRDHERKKHEGTKLECKECDKQFISQSGLYIHKISAHKNLTWKCDDCHKLFATKNKMRDHKNRVHDPNIERHNCNQCDASVSQKYSLNSLYLHKISVPH